MVAEGVKRCSLGGRCKSIDELISRHGGLARWAVRRELGSLRALRGFPNSWDWAFDEDDILQTVFADVARYASRYVAAMRQDHYLSFAAKRMTRQYVNEWYGFNRTGRRADQTWRVAGKLCKSGTAFGACRDSEDEGVITRALNRASVRHHLDSGDEGSRVRI